MYIERSTFVRPASCPSSTALPAVGQNEISRRESGKIHLVRAPFVRVLSITLLALFAFAASASGQASTVFPSVNVQSTATQLVTVQIPSTATLGSIQVLTAGAENLDYQSVSGGSCTTNTLYTAPATCTVNVSLTPGYPGVRDGAVVLLDTLGNPMGLQPIHGIGVGPLSVLSAGEITTVAGNGQLRSDSTTSPLAVDIAVGLPFGEAVDGVGNLYFTESTNHRIGRVDHLTGNLTYVAGNGVAGHSPDGTQATLASIDTPAAILVDGAGNIYFTEIGNNDVREIVQTTGLIQTVAGTGTQGYKGDSGAATSAWLNIPQGIAFDATHNLYIADTGNNVIRRVNASDGKISTIAGDGNPGFAGDGGAAAGAEFNQPYGIAFASDGTLYVADFFNNRIRRIDTSGGITTVVGTGAADYSGDTREASGAAIHHPSSVGVDAGGDLYLSDSENNVVRKVNAYTGIITTYAGNSAGSSVGDGFNADSGQASMNKTYGLTIDPAGNLFVADYAGSKIREVLGNQARIVFKDIKATNTSPPTSQRLDNDGNAPLQLTNIVPVSNSAIDPSSTTCTTASVMAPGAECVIGVEFKPAAPGTPVTGSVSVTSNAANTPDTIVLSGNALTIEPSTVTLTSSLNPSSFGQTVTFTAAVSTLATNEITAVVNFYADGVLIGSPATNPTSRKASVQISSLIVGTHTITAAFSGDSSSAPSPTATLTQVVKQASVVTLTSSPNPSLLDGPVTLTAQIASLNNVPPTGTVTFTDSDGTLLGTATVNPGNGNGFATTSGITSLSAGTHTITAAYSGDTNYGVGTATAPQTVQQIPTTVTVASSANPSIAGGTVNFTLIVTAQDSTSPNLPLGGSVSLFDNGKQLTVTPTVTALGTNPARTTVTIPVSGLSAGTHNITAAYSGDSNYLGSNNSLNPQQTAVPATSSVVLTASSATAIAGQPVNFTATVTGNGGTPGGTVNFSIDGTTLIGGTLANGIASIASSTLSVGTHTVTAKYLGDANDGAASSNQVSVTIVAATTTTTLASSQNPLLTLAPVNITATVANGGGATPTGTVTFSQDSVAVSTMPVTANGTATLSIPSLSAGTHTFSAAYSGDGINLASSSTTLSETVQLRSTTDALTTSATSLTGGQQLTLISIVRWTGSTTPSGTVTFFNGTLALAAAPVDPTGVATVTVLLSGTSASLSSVYSGDDFYATSTSPPSLVTIGPAANFDFTASPSTFSLVTSQHSTVTINISSLKGFTDTISLGCLGLPLAATCNFSTDQFVLAPTGGQTIQLTVDTGNPLLAGAQAKNEVPQPLGASGSKLIAACLLPGSLLLGLVGLRFRRLRNFRSLIMIVLLLAGLATTLTGCGTIKLTSTPPGIYNFAVTATGRTGVSQSIPVTMTVTP